jgi:hypothetical protein
MKDYTKDYTKGYTKDDTKDYTKDSTPSAYSENFFNMTHDIPPPPFCINELKSKYNSNIKPRKHDNQH